MTKFLGSVAISCCSKGWSGPGIAHSCPPHRDEVTPIKSHQMPQALQSTRVFGHHSEQINTEGLEAARQSTGSLLSGRPKGRPRPASVSGRPHGTERWPVSLGSQSRLGPATLGTRGTMTKAVRAKVRAGAEAESLTRKVWWLPEFLEQKSGQGEKKEIQIAMRWDC